jgi:hypothetical protein
VEPVTAYLVARLGVLILVLAVAFAVEAIHKHGWRVRRWWRRRQRARMRRLDPRTDAQILADALRWRP